MPNKLLEHLIVTSNTQKSIYAQAIINARSHADAWKKSLRILPGESANQFCSRFDTACSYQSLMAEDLRNATNSANKIEGILMKTVDGIYWIKAGYDVNNDSVVDVERFCMSLMGTNNGIMQGFSASLRADDRIQARKAQISLIQGVYEEINTQHDAIRSNLQIAQSRHHHSSV